MKHPEERSNTFFLLGVLLMFWQGTCVSEVRNKARSRLRVAARKARVKQRPKVFEFCRFNCGARKITTDPDILLEAAEYVLRYFNSMRRVDRNNVRSKLLEKRFITTRQAEDTLKFIVGTIKRDKVLGRRPRILDPKFLKRNFTFIRWNADIKAARRNKVSIPKWYDGGKLKDGKIKLTSYALFRRKGSYHRTRKRQHAIYEIVSEEFETKFRYLHSKQHILAGALKAPKFDGHIKPLAWLTQEDLDEALMQGSIIVVMPDGKERLFNAYKSNGPKFPYDKRIKNRKNQKKYWFFKEITSAQQPVLKFGGIAFAGDVRSIGLGKIIALQYVNTKTGKEEVRLGVLADRGSAFSKNLYQLDLYSGTFNSQAAFKRFIREFPPSVKAYILKRRKFAKRHKVPVYKKWNKSTRGKRVVSKRRG